MLMNAYQENTIVPQSANVSILWVHISAHIVDLDILTMERPVKVRFAYNEEDNKDKKKNSGHTYKDQQQCNGGDSKSCISNKRNLIKLGQLPFISYSDRQIKRQTDRE